MNIQAPGTPVVVQVPFDTSNGLLADQYSIFLESVMTVQEFSSAIQTFNSHIFPFATSARAMIRVMLIIVFVFFFSFGMTAFWSVNEYNSNVIMFMFIFPPLVFLLISVIILVRVKKIRTQYGTAVDMALLEINRRFAGRPVNWRFVQTPLGTRGPAHVEVEVRIQGPLPTQGGIPQAPLGYQNYPPNQPIYQTPYAPTQQPPYQTPYPTQPNYTQPNYTQPPAGYPVAYTQQLQVEYQGQPVYPTPTVETLPGSDEKAKLLG